MVRGRAWIPLLGVMLVGIVAMQVELLKLNAATGRSIELISSLQSRNDALRAAVASDSDPTRIERIATGMGMTMPGPEAITFLSARSASVHRALARIQPPNVAAFEAALRVTNASASTAAAGALPPLTPPPATSRRANNSRQTTASTTTSTAATTTTAGQTTTTPQTTTAGQTSTPAGQTTTAGQTSTPAGQTTTAGQTSTDPGQTNTAAAPPATVP